MARKFKLRAIESESESFHEKSGAIDRREFMRLSFNTAAGLITTASFGSDAYEFAKNKPISLVDGTNLLLLLKNHQLNYVIDIEEAKRNLGQT